MGTQDYINLVKEAFEGFNLGNFDRLISILAEDATYYFPGTTPFSGTIKGKEAIKNFFAQVGKLFPQGIKFEIKNVVGTGNVVAIEWEDRATTAQGKAYENKGVHFIEFEGEKVKALREYLDTEKVKALI